MVNVRPFSLESIHGGEEMHLAGDSSWNLIHAGDHFDVKKVMPFGCLVSFLPQPDYALRLPKFSTRGIPGVLLGYHMLPGLRWSGSYYVAALADFVDLKVKPKIQTVKRIKQDGYGQILVSKDFVFR